MARPNVPKFGNWENEDNTPYTVYFDKARKTRGGKMINPNDPQENPDLFPNMKTPPQKEEPPIRSEAPKEINRRRVSRDEGDNHFQQRNSPAHNESRGHSTQQQQQQQQRHGGRGSSSGRPSRQSGGSDHSFDKSPLHPHLQAKLTGRVAASPVWEGKSSHDSGHGNNTHGRSYDSSHGTPGRSFESSHAAPGRHQMKQESPDRGAVVPKFGEWDDNDPQSAENYTEVFNKVRDERHVGAGNVVGTPGRTSYNTHRNNKYEKQKKSCFPCW